MRRRPWVLLTGTTAVALAACPPVAPPPEPPPTPSLPDGGVPGATLLDPTAASPPEPPARRYDPCEGRACGDPCSLCPPDALDCREVPALKRCDAAHECTTRPGSCP
ncbi:MAG: hypothetical protein IT373_09225 [Polyangiaceae bacterium]|nr:hypothetical protein [Polyangiaceae bacterium]